MYIYNYAFEKLTFKNHLRISKKLFKIYFKYNKCCHCEAFSNKIKAKRLWQSSVLYL